MNRPSVRSVLAALVAATMAACTAPPPPAPAPVAAPVKKAAVKVTPPPTPAPVAVAPAPVAPTDQFKVTAVRTPFYNFGPQQPGGPNQSLDYGVSLTLLKRGFGYSKVRLKDQQTGYVATEDIAALTPQELMAQEQPEPPPSDLGPLPRPGGVRRSVLPPSTAVDLPEAEPKTEAASEAKAEPTPKFRD